MLIRSPVLRDRSRALHAQLERSLPTARDAPALLETVREVLDCSLVVFYEPRVGERGWDLVNAHSGGHDGGEEKLDRFRALVRAAPASVSSFAAYEPYNAEPLQRNRALPLRALFSAEQFVAGNMERVFSRIKLVDQDQLRIIITNGPRVIGYLGAHRREPFTSDEVGMLNAIAKPLHSWSNALRRTDSNAAGLEPIMDAIPGAAFVVSRREVVEHMNRQAQALLHQRPDAVFETLRRVRAGHPPEGVTITVLDRSVGAGALLMVIAAQDETARVVAMGHAWRATPRQLRVLELLAEGRSNKEIAIQMTCSEVTVESHITQLYRKAKVRSRTELLAKLFNRRAGSIGRAE